MVFPIYNQDDPIGLATNKLLLLPYFTHNSFINRLQSLTTTNAAYLCPEMCPEKALGWPERLAILIGVAKAVHFLHTGVIPGAFNNRLKTDNILLDEHRIAKLSDYGMSIITDEIEKPEVHLAATHAKLFNL